VRFLNKLIASLLAAIDPSGCATLNINLAVTKRGKTCHFHREWEEDSLSPISKDLP